MKTIQRKIFYFSFIILSFLLLNGCDKIEISGESVDLYQSDMKPKLKVFLENSGSMDGYMCDGSQLKDAIYDYISELNRLSDTTELYFINSKIIPYSGKLQSFVKNMTPATFHAAGGNTSNTDIGDLIDKVLSTLNDSTVSIFISDCILDLPTKNATDFLNNCEITIKQHIIETQKRVPELGVEILQLTSKFSGRYFSPNGKIENLKDVQRPYYIWMFGNKKYLAEFNDEPLKTIMQSKYNYKGMVSFSNESNYSAYEIKNPSFTSNEIIPTGNFYRVAMKANMSLTLQPESVILDKQNYHFNNAALKIEDIRTIDKKNDKTSYTHVIYFNIPKHIPLAQDRLTFEAPTNLPSWVSQSNDDMGDNINDNLDKTTGIQYLIQGVADAFKNEKILTSYNFKIKKK